MTDQIVPMNETKVSSEEKTPKALPLHERLSTLDQKIIHLKKRKENLQTQQALSFLKETQKIFKEEMPPDVILILLTETWNKSSPSQKEEWRKRISKASDPEKRETEHSFRPSCSLEKKATSPQPASQPNGSQKAQSHDKI